MAIPWIGLLKGAASIMATASGLKDLWTLKSDLTKQPATGETALAKRVADLETREVRQSQLVEEMAVQISSLTKALKVVSTRFLVAILIGAVALTAAVSALLVALL